jgi:hypothetical protein
MHNIHTINHKAYPFIHTDLSVLVTSHLDATRASLIVSRDGRTDMLSLIVSRVKDIKGQETVSELYRV